MGWQERTARNAQMDANYRAALGYASSEGIAADTNLTSLAKEGMGNRTARDIAQRRNRTAIEGTRIRTGALITNREAMEAGMDRRQGSRQEFLSGEQEKKYGFLEGESEKERESRLQLYREQGAVSLASSGVLKEPQQVSDYMGDPQDYEIDPGGLGAVDKFDTPTGKGVNFEHIPPIFGKETDEKFREKSVEVAPRGRFDPVKGIFEEYPKKQSIVEKHFDDATGTTKIPMENINDAELDELIETLKKKRKQNQK